MSEYHILNLGAGVQSTTLYLLSVEGRIQRFDAAIFADTQDETAKTYKHLEWLGQMAWTMDSQSPKVQSSQHGARRFVHLGKDNFGPRILVRTTGCLSADLTRGENSTGQRFATIPAFTAIVEGGDAGQTRRQCTKEYKIELIERTIRREILGLKPKRRIPKGITVHQYIGISWDERSRAADIEFRRFRDPKTGGTRKGWAVGFPLLTINGEMKPGWTRTDCERWLAPRVPHKVPRSACKQCPFHSDAEWARLKQMPEEWAQIVGIDSAMREPGRIVNRNMDQKLYLHRACRPIDKIDFANENQLGFAMECEGGCGL